MIVELTDVRPPKQPSFAFVAGLFGSAHWHPAVGELPERTEVRLTNGVIGYVKEMPHEVVACVDKAMGDE